MIDQRNLTGGLGTMNALEQTQLEQLPEKTVARIRRYIDASVSKNTKRAYRADWADFAQWCRETGHNPLPASFVAVIDYLTDLADRGRAVSTIRRRMTTIAQLHRGLGHRSPTDAEPVRRAWKGIRRELGVAPDRKAAAVSEDLIAMVKASGTEAVVMPGETADGLRQVRDHALLLIGYAAALRRSELVALRVDDLEFRHGVGAALTIRRSKADQYGAGAVVPIAHGQSTDTCPVFALRRWLDVAKIGSGPLFRGIDKHGNIAKRALSGRTVARIVKAAALQAGLNAARYGGHSLRSGAATTMARSGATMAQIAAITRHASYESLKCYIREGRLHQNPATGMLGL